ncbi:MAG: hypothetical protein Q9N62_03335 [Ghiorsea sp.]|nr:hypothetical protein [Ghiorsea sp.]
MMNNGDVSLSSSVTAVLDNIQESMEGEVHAIDAQAEQVASLLKDAISSLHEAFDSIHSASDQQMKTMTALMSDVTGTSDEANIFQKAESASETLTYMIDALLLSGKNNLHALTVMDTMQQRMQVMMTMEKKQSALIDQLCACDTQQTPETRQLIADIRDEQEKHVNYTSETQLKFQETHSLIDAIASKDMDDVFSAKAKVEEILNHIFQINDTISASRTQVNEVNANMRKYLGAAIRALQFEDISTQSIGYMKLHLGRMNGMLAILNQGLQGLKSEGVNEEDYVQRITAIHASMIAYHQTLKLESSNPVSQESMDEGDIDLF